MYTLFSLFLLKNIDCGYSLEPPLRGGTNEYPQSMLWVEIWKISEFLSENFQFLVVTISIYLNRRVFIMILLYMSLCICYPRISERRVVTCTTFLRFSLFIYLFIYLFIFFFFSYDFLNEAIYDIFQFAWKRATTYENIASDMCAQQRLKSICASETASLAIQNASSEDSDQTARICECIQ